MARVCCAEPAESQTFDYVEAGVAGCPATMASSGATAKTVMRGVAVQGVVRVSCGFSQGSYTVTLNATDPDAAFAPRSFLVNFGRIVGDGVFTVTFSTLGIHRLSTTITSNMGSPAVKGRFVSAGDTFHVVSP